MVISMVVCVDRSHARRFQHIGGLRHHHGSASAGLYPVEMLPLLLPFLHPLFLTYGVTALREFAEISYKYNSTSAW